MKRLFKFILVTMMSVGMMFPTHLSANASSRTYEITFKSGSKGTFDTSNLKGNYTLNEDHTSITYTVKAGDAFPQVPTVIAQDGYRNNTWNNELPLVGSSVEEKQVYVAKYTKLVNAVEFTVSYVDTNGVEIETPTIYTTDLNTEEVVRAKTIDGYQPDALQKRLVVSRENVEIQFVYTPLEDATQPPVIEQIVEVEGDPVYRDVIVGTGAGAGTTTGTAGGGAGAGAGDATGAGDEVVDENETPLAGGNEEEIQDNETPLASGKKTSNQTLYIASGAGAIAVIALVAYMIKKKKEEVSN